MSPRWIKKRQSRSVTRVKRRPPQFEYLEARRVLATVTLNTDTGSAGELRTEIANAAPGDTIDFNLPAGNETIVLDMSLGELSVDKDLTIDGDNSAGSGVDVTISGGDSVRVLTVDDGDADTYAAVELRNVTISGGLAYYGGGIHNAEVLTVTGSTVSGNTATSGTGGGINTVGYGSELHLIDSTVDGNYAFGAGLCAVYTPDPPYEPYVYCSGDRQNYYRSPATGGGVFVSLGSLTIEGSTISNNSASGPDGTDMAGGGIAVASHLAPDYTQSAPLNVNISGSMITGNIVTGQAFEDGDYSNGVDPYGGGFYASGYGQVTITDSTISGNIATGIGPSYSRGGGAAFFARGYSSLNVDIVDSEFTSNYSLSGGTIFASQSYYYASSMQLNISNSSITDNTVAYYGGGVFSRGRYAERGTFVTTVTGSTISGNTAGGSGGLTVWNADLIVEDSVVSGNSSVLTPNGMATGEGGGFGGGISAWAVYEYSYSLGGPSNNEQPTLVVRNTTISGNSAAGTGGGIYAYGADLEIIQSTISGNTAGVDGGGLGVETYYSSDYSGSTSIERSTFTRNSAGGTYYGGGGMYVDFYHDQFAMSNTIVSGNTGLNADIYDYTTSTVSSNTTYSLIGDNRGSGFAEANPGPDGGGNIVGGPVGGIVDALLGPLTDTNGGPTPTHLPAMTSPAVDTGDPSVTAGTDQRGFGRVANGRMDIGSTEFGAVVEIDGDFNNDELWNCDDINALTTEVADGTNNAAFDLTDDGLVNGDDIAAWLVEGGAMNPAQTGGNPFLPSDADLSGDVDGADFLIWNTTKFTSNSNWCDGDFDGSGFVDGSDFLTWNTFKFMSSDQARFVAPGRDVEANAERPTDRQRTTPTLDSSGPTASDVSVARLPAKQLTGLNSDATKIKPSEDAKEVASNEDVKMNMLDLADSTFK